MAGYSVSMVAQVWDDRTGDRWELKEDGNALGLAWIRFVDDTGKTVQEVTMPVEVLRALMAQADKVFPPELDGRTGGDR